MKRLLLVLALCVLTVLFVACEDIANAPYVVGIRLEGGFADCSYVLLGTDFPTDMRYREILSDNSLGALEYVTGDMVTGYDMNAEGFQAITVRYNKDVKIVLEIYVIGTVINDTAEFEAALIGQADGQVWLVTENTYDLPVCINSDLVILGEGNVVITLSDYDVINEKDYAALYDTTVETYYGLMFFEDCNATVKNVTIVGDPDEAFDSGVVGNRYAGIVIFDSTVVLDGVTVEDITGYTGDQTGYGILAPTDNTFNNGQKITVNGCTFLNFQKDAVVVRYVEELVFTNNYVEGIDGNSVLCSNGLVFSCENVTICGNAFIDINYDDTDSAIAIVFYVYDNPFYYDTAVIDEMWIEMADGNTIENCDAKFGIFFYNSIDDEPGELLYV